MSYGPDGASKSSQKAPYGVSGAFQMPVNVLPAAGSDWDPFVMGFPDSSIYHLSGWTEIAREVFGHHVLFLESRDASGSLLGVLPVIRQRSWLLGNFATSLAFFNYGGALAADPLVAQQMMIRAAEAAEALGCRYLEFRDTQPRPGGWARRTDKATLRLDLPDTVEALAKRLGSKLRSQVKRADREGVQCRTGTMALLDDFYAVFAENMRDLGTPVYPKRFFAKILERFEQHCQLVVIESQGEPWAVAFLVFWRGCAEVPWASCRAKAKPLGANMKLYWELLSQAIGRGCTSFDFGRSTVDSGTDRFKRQWGAEPMPLHWCRWERQGNGHDGSTVERTGKAMQLATTIWQHLPLRVANTLGPLISGALPW
ncbi:MAG TPA: FemAB family XrtA/PEP-CTERM system-associated protein [Steroidobacteraceae bacterium]